MAHFCEHMTFKGTERRGSMKILGYLESVGGDLNAFTNKEETVYHAAVLKDDIDRAVDLLTDIVFNSTYPQAEIDKEVEVIIDEIESYNDSPSELVYDLFENAIYKGHPLGHNILGSADQLRTYTTADAKRFTARYYRPENCVFFAYGDVDFGRLVKLLERACALPAGTAPVLPIVERRIKEAAEGATLPPYVAQTLEKHMDTHLAHVMLGTRSYGIGFDMGGYYLTALAAILGPVRSVAAFTATNDPDRVNTRIGAPGFGQAYDVQVPNVISATMQYANGVLGTLHMNSDCIEDEETCLKIYGTEGILTMGDPNQFGAPVYLQKPLCEPVEFPFTHGYQENSRGLGAAEMAWSILAGRDHRASKEMAYHVFETMHGIMTSAETGSFCQLQSTFQTPAALPAGYRSVGDWSRKEESALI